MLVNKSIFFPFIYIYLIKYYIIIFNTDADLTMTGCRNNQTLGADLTTGI